jgi:hypothetical protein
MKIRLFPRPVLALVTAAVVVVLAAAGLSQKVFVATPAFSAAAPLAASWISGIQVQNLDPANAANITITYHRSSDGSVAATQSDVIPANSSKTYFGPTMVVPAGFSGSAVITSDREIAAIVNEIADPPMMTASYGGAALTATTNSLPLIMRNNSGNNTTIYTQNAGSAPANVQISFRGPSNYDLPAFTLQPGQSRTIAQETMVAELTSPNGRWVGAATVTSNQPMATTVNQIDSNNNILFSYTGFTTSASKAYAPLLMDNNSGWFTGFQVMNTGAAPATVDLKVDGAVVDTQVIGAGASFTWFPVPGMATKAGNNKKIAAGAAEGRTGTEQLVGIVNEVGPASAGLPVTQGSSYKAFLGGTAKVFAPLLMTNNSGLYTGFQVMNIGTAAATVDLFVDGALKDTAIIQPGNSKTWFPIPGQATKVGSGYAQGRGAGDQLVGIVNEIKSGTGDNAMSYEGINQ